VIDARGSVRWPHASRPRRARRRARVPRLVFPRSVMLSTTTERRRHGLDVYAALPAGRAPAPRRVTGWCQATYCGFPLFQFYFRSVHRDRARVLRDPAQHRLQAGLAARHVPAAGVRVPLAPLRGRAVSRARAGGARHAPFIFMEANSMWGATSPPRWPASSPSRSDGARGALRRHAPAHGRHGPRARLERAPGGADRPGARLHAPLGRLHVARRAGRAARLVAAGGTLVATHGLAILLLGFWLLPCSPTRRGRRSTATCGSSTRGGRSCRPSVAARSWRWWTALAVGVVALVKREPYRARWRPCGRDADGIIFYFTARTFHVVDIRFFPFSSSGSA